jgi:N-acetylmuramoyl-L-alanine amidase
VLKGAHMPSVLIEVGFLTNSLEALKLKEFRYLDKVSRALAEGILAYKSAFERTNGFTQ